MASPLAPGYYCFRADWPGDNHYPGALSATNTSTECFRVKDTSTTTTGAGDYLLSITREGYSPLNQGELRVGTSELVSVELKLLRIGAREEEKKIEPGPPTPYGTVVRPKDDPNAVATPLPPGEKVYLPVPDRWNAVST